MTRNLLLVLLLATGVAQAADPPADKPAAPAPQGDARPKEADAKARAVDAKAREAEARAKEAEAKPKEADSATTEAETRGPDDANLGMSILGNQEAPKSLVIVPWKSSEIGRSLGISTMLDDSRQPIDKEVFMRVLSYYDLRSTTTTTHRRKP